MTCRRRVTAWFDARTGYRAGLRHLLAEPLVSGVNWWFTLGSVLLFLLVVQGVTGATLMLYYVPAPAHAYDSLRFITTGLRFGHVLRGLHVVGASVIVVAAGLHLLRVLVYGAYQAPREVTWWTGIALLLVIIALALTGYLLPWDQRAYWATVVTINIVKSLPGLGPPLAAVLRGGPAIGALTLNRWFTAHVLLLPALLGLGVVTHLYLMRRHGIAGPPVPRAAPPAPFYPDHAVKDLVVIAAVFAGVLALAIWAPLPLAAPADPAAAGYVPRPEWYFLGLFQLLKYFPGRLEPIAAHGLPALLVLLLVSLPFLDRGPDRRLRARTGVLLGTALVVSGVALLTLLGWRDAAANARAPAWGARAIAGADLVQSAACTRCHAPGGAGPDLTRGQIGRDAGWMRGHVSDPDMIAPGLRPPPRGGLSETGVRAVLAALALMRAGVPAPVLAPTDRLALDVLGTRCIACHVLDGDGGTDGPALTHAARTPGHDAAWFARWIADPTAVEAKATMPAFGDLLSDAELQAIARYLATRR